MKLREFFDPSPIRVEALDNPDQDHHRDGTDDELEMNDVDNMEGDAGDDEGIEQMLSMADSEPGDGDDLGSPENILLMPHVGHGTDFVMSPDRMGGARGTFGMHSDGAGHRGEIVDKSSAWDVLAKVVNALGEDEAENSVFGDEQ